MVADATLHVHIEPARQDATQFEDIYNRMTVII